MNIQERKARGQGVRDARKARKLKQQELADAVNVSLGTIQNLESGKRETHPTTVVAVQAALGMAGDEAATVASWPNDVKVVVDMVGLWLLAQTPEERERFALEMTRRIIGSAPSSQK